MKKLLIALMAVVMSLPMLASISNIERDGSWYKVYDENGKRYKTVSVSGYGELKGFSGSLAIFQRGSFYYIYNSDMKQIKSGSVSSYGDIISVSGDTFTTRRGNWIYTYDKNGKQLNSRAK